MTPAARTKPYGIGRVSFVVRTILLVAICFTLRPDSTLLGEPLGPLVAIAVRLAAIMWWVVYVVPARMINGGVSLWSLLILLIPGGNLLLLVALCLRKPRQRDDSQAVPAACQLSHPPGLQASATAASLVASTSHALPMTPQSKGTAVAPAGTEIKTMIGVVVFPTTHAAGKYGDWLTAIYYTRRGYKKLRSKRTAVHGIDGVYVRRRPNAPDAYNVHIVENKINRSRLQRNQLSDSGILQRCHDLMKSGDEELAFTAEVVIKALQGDTNDKPFRILITHNLEVGISVRHLVDTNGEQVRKLGQWKNQETIRKTLNAKIRKGKVQRR